MSESEAIVPKKSIKRIVKEDFKVSDTKVENLHFFTDRILKKAYDINLDSHHDNYANSIITISSKFINIGIDTIHINDRNV